MRCCVVGSCRAAEFTCTNHACIDVSQRCNGVVDCDDGGSDEHNCTRMYCPLCPTVQARGQGGGAARPQNASAPVDQRSKIKKKLKIAFFCLLEVFCDQNVCQNAFSTPLPRLHPIQRLWRLYIAPQLFGQFDPRAFIARHSCPPRPSLVSLR